MAVLELKGIADFTDYFVICSGESSRQVRTIAEYIEETLKKDPARLRPFGVEGLVACRWVLMDYSDVIVHIFEEETRRFYRLERLWLDAPHVPVAEGPWEER